MANRLGLEKSPYLLQHKDNPVDWYPWCEEAFRNAKEEDKPVFLSIGYSTCHWCHVMAHESFEDEETARLLDDFICIKVDREERPDVDAVYMTVCQALTGSGGWPLTVFMTPDQKPFFAGTYFPRTSRYGQLGLQDLLRQITRLWRSDREKLFKAGNQITAAIQTVQAPTSGDPNWELLQKGYRLLRQSFDFTWGGFYMTAYDAQPLITRPKETYDGAIPSGNSTAAVALERLAELTGETLFREASDRQLAFLAGKIKDYPAGYCYALLAMSRVLYPHRELLCTGDHIPDEVISNIQTKPSHNLSILYKSKENAKELTGLAPFTETYPASDRSVFYLCENGVCRRPKSEFEQLNL